MCKVKKDLEKIDRIAAAKNVLHAIENTEIPGKRDVYLVASNGFKLLDYKVKRTYAGIRAVYKKGVLVIANPNENIPITCCVSKSPHDPPPTIVRMRDMKEMIGCVSLAEQVAGIWFNKSELRKKAAEAVDRVVNEILQDAANAILDDLEVKTHEMIEEANKNWEEYAKILEHEQEYKTEHRLQR